MCFSSENTDCSALRRLLDNGCACVFQPSAQRQQRIRLWRDRRWHLKARFDTYRLIELLSFCYTCDEVVYPILKCSTPPSLPLRLRETEPLDALVYLLPHDLERAQRNGTQAGDHLDLSSARPNSAEVERSSRGNFVLDWECQKATQEHALWHMENRYLLSFSPI